MDRRILCLLAAGTLLGSFACAQDPFLRYREQYERAAEPSGAAEREVSAPLPPAGSLAAAEACSVPPTVVSGPPAAAIGPQPLPGPAVEGYADPDAPVRVYVGSPTVVFVGPGMTPSALSNPYILKDSKAPSKGLPPTTGTLPLTPHPNAQTPGGSAKPPSAPRDFNKPDWEKRD